MTPWTVKEILQATEGRLLRGRFDQKILGISIDSRGIAPQEAFVAIRGHRFDGHDFLDEAIKHGASCLIISRDVPSLSSTATLPVILVNDTTEALGDLARFHRRRMNKPVIAVTGSCGKTTTKELIAHIIGEPDAVLAGTAPPTLLMDDPNASKDAGRTSPASPPTKRHP